MAKKQSTLSFSIKNNSLFFLEILLSNQRTMNTWMAYTLLYRTNIYCLHSSLKVKAMVLRWLLQLCYFSSWHNCCNPWSLVLTGASHCSTSLFYIMTLQIFIPFGRPTQTASKVGITFLNKYHLVNKKSNNMKEKKNKNPLLFFKHFV